MVRPPSFTVPPPPAPPTATGAVSPSRSARRTSSTLRWPGRSAAKVLGLTAASVPCLGRSGSRTVWLRSRALRAVPWFQASTGASRAPSTTTVAIMPAETIPAKRRSRAREERTVDLPECPITDFVGTSGAGLEPLRRAWTVCSMPAPARHCAFAVLRRVFEDGAWADRALRGEAKRLGLDARDLALATRLAYGAVQRRATLDHVIETLSGRSLDRLEPAVVAALRLGIFQLVYLDRVPAHAAVAESVELAKAESRGGAGLVNAVLRRAAREAEALVGALPDRTPEEAALRLSHPEWIARLWWDAFGRDTARALMSADNDPAEASLRGTPLRTRPAEQAGR